MTDSDMSRAARLYKAFREESVKRARRVSVSLPKAVAKMGTAEFIGYWTTHHGKPALYVHHWAPGSRPDIYANTGRGQLYLFGGRYTATGRGITDLDAHGRVVDYTPPYVVVERAEWEEYQRSDVYRRKHNLTKRRRRY